MKKGHFRYGLALVLIACLLAFPIGCGSPSDKDLSGQPVNPPAEDGGGEEDIQGEAEPGEEPPVVEEPVEPVTASLNLTIDPTGINVEGTATVTATARDSDNNPVPDGTTVVYWMGDSAFGTVTESSTTTAGITTATFTAANSPGTATIHGSSGDAADSVTVDILQVPAAAIQFVSADPDVIALVGTGGTEISELQFRVLDSNNNPLEGINVAFSMVGPNGGEYIVPDLPDSASTDANGIVFVRLYSGGVAGPATVSATADIGDPPTLTTVQSTVVSIGGGVPSDFRFSVSASILNLPGLVWNGKETEVSAWLADRFGSYNILEGTTVSFGTEVGIATDTANVTLDDDGVTEVTVRTQAGAGGAHAEDVLPEPWEQALQAYMAGVYGYTTTTHPRDGLCSVFVYTKGEEQFDDLNANGVYDFGTDLFLPAYDTAEDPFYDYDDDDQYNDGSTYPVGGPPYNPAEIFIDSAPANGTWDGGDGVWSEDTYIFRNLKILVTGRPIFLASDYSFDIPDGGSQTIGLVVCDINLNPLTPGSNVQITCSGGAVTGRLEYEYPNSSQVGPDLPSHLWLIEFPVTISDDNPGSGPDAAEIEVDIQWVPAVDEPETWETWKYKIGGVIQ